MFKGKNTSEVTVGNHLKNKLPVVGYEVGDEETGISIPVRYDAIRFFVGYHKERDSALVEVTDAYVEMPVDEDGKTIDYEYGTDPKTGEPMVWSVESVVYDLGKILEYTPKKKA